eukprot:TRINITY_DN412_c0_g1_i3.p1 TRINITY_DN412_c0_g1~~TRINITY_DN412_c0_g1_i3.p1  ORF type:complete len:306 (-),score=97.50 TRINITY_DN412_c0_g1_i3:341-1258(-)
MDEQLNESVLAYLQSQQLENTLLGDIAGALQVDTSVLSNSTLPSLNDVFAAVHEEETVDPVLEKKFKAYESLLKSRGYFQGTEEGSQEYNDRLNKARDRFFQKFSGKQAVQKKEEVDQYANLTQEEKNAKADEIKAQGNQHIQNQEYEQALKCYTTAIKLNPQNHIYYGNRAAAHVYLQNYEQSIADSNEALRVNPQYARAYSRLGYAYFQLDEFDKAIESYETGLEIDPSSRELKTGLDETKQKIELINRQKAAQENMKNLFSGNAQGGAALAGMFGGAGQGNSGAGQGSEGGVPAFDPSASCI